MTLRLAADLTLRSLVALFVSLGVASTLVEQGTFLTPEPSVRVTSSSFGTWSLDDAFPSTDRIPLVAGGTFGWRVVVPDGRPVVWHEELILPEAPAQWSGGGFVDISDDGRIAWTAGVDAPWEGVLEHGWAITEGDPAGEYELRLWIDGRLHDRFFFRVE